MRKYKYTNPIDIGYKKFKLTKKQHNGLFKNRKVRWVDRYEYYYNDDQIILHKFINWKGVLYCTLTFPIAVLLNGVLNFKEIWEELMELYNQKKCGSFISEYVYGDRYEKIMKLINNKLI